MQGVPSEDLQRHRNGLPMIAYKRIKVSEGGLLPLLAAQKATVPEAPDLDIYNPPAQGGTVSPLPAASIPIISSGPVIAAPAITSPPMPLLNYAPPYHHGTNLPFAATSGVYVSAPISSSGGSSGQSSTRTLSEPILPASPLMAVNRGPFDNIVVPPTVDPAGKSIPGSIIVYPDLTISIVLSLPFPTHWCLFFCRRRSAPH